MNISEFVESMNTNEIEEFSKKLHVWLSCYTDDVVNRVMSNIEEVINNPFAMKMIDELYSRSIEEKNDEVDSIKCYFRYDFDMRFIERMHSHPLEHSDSYRDILYDMFIGK